MAHDGKAQRALSRAVGSHQGVDFAAPDGEADSLQDRLARHLDVQIADRQNIAHVLLFSLVFELLLQCTNPASVFSAAIAVSSGRNQAATPRSEAAKIAALAWPASSFTVKKPAAILVSRVSLSLAGFETDTRLRRPTGTG